MHAAFEGHVGIVTRLLEANSTDPNLEDKKRETALMHAVRGNKVETVTRLLASNADPNLKNKDGWTALMIASKLGHQGIVTRLLEAHADPNLNNNDGWTALMHATFRGREGVVTRLLAAHADANVRGARSSALGLAVETEHGGLVCELLDAGADPNWKNEEDGKTALMDAVSMGFHVIAVHLLAYDADPNLSDNEGRTAFVEAVARHEPEFDYVVAQMLAAKADPNSKDADGRTALMVAASHRSPERVTMLLKAGATPTLRRNGIRVETTPLIEAMVIAAASTRARRNNPKRHQRLNLH